MKVFQQLFLVAFLLMNLGTLKAQSHTPPHELSGDDLGFYVDKFNLNYLNPAYISGKTRRQLIQEWDATKWVNVEQELTQFNANCALTTQKTRASFDSLRKVFVAEGLDSFVYASGRLSAFYKYNLSSSGVRSLSLNNQYFYTGTRAAPDSIVSANVGTSTETTRFKYSFNANNQLTGILSESKQFGVYQPSKRSIIEYDTRGNLTRYRIEFYETLAWVYDEEHRYAYSATNQLTERLSIDFNYADTSKAVYSYNALNQLTKIVELGYGLRRTLRDTGTVITYSNYNAKNRPRIYEEDGLRWSDPSFIKATITYQTNDTLAANILVQFKGAASDPLENGLRIIYEYCGDPVATNEIKTEPLIFQVYPNPVSDVLNLKLSDEQSADKADIRIQTATGQIVFSEQNRPINTPLSISSLPNGVYFLQVKSINKVGIQPFTVIR